MNGGLCRVGLIVTGKGEEDSLHEVFNHALMPHANCLFSIIGRVPQLPPATASKAQIKITGTSRQAESWDERIGLWALGFLRQYPGSLVVVLDDIEHDRRPVIDRVFGRYRDALDSVLAKPGLSGRTSVHFLANMKEAYYFAHSSAVNGVAGAAVLAADHPTDVEQIRDPKNSLAAVWPGKFRERRDGNEIIRALDLAHILARPQECCWLRAMVAWCLDRFNQQDIVYPGLPPDPYCVVTGQKAPLTYPQM
jgi:hypothetical protein